MSEDKTIIAEQFGMTFFNPGRSHKRSCLIQYNGANIGKRYNLDNAETIAGRSPDSGILLNDPSVSRQHGRFVHRGDRIELEDMGTTNGTFLNDKRLEKRQELKDGDIIRLGNVLLKYYATADIESLLIDKIYKMATIDVGTQIFNKKALLESLDQAIKVSRSYGQPLSLIYYDLDFFRNVNNNHGHNAGDFMLRETAKLVSTVIRKDDIFGRFGGEEFCIVLPGTELKTAVELAERIRKAIEDQVFEFEGKTLKQTTSLGVAQLSPAMKEAKDFLDAADQKLIRSKNEGRNRVTV